MKQEIIAIIKWQYWLFNHGDVDETIRAEWVMNNYHGVDKRIEIMKGGER